MCSILLSLPPEVCFIIITILHGGKLKHREITLLKITQSASDDPGIYPKQTNSEPTTLNSVLQTFNEAESWLPTQYLGANVPALDQLLIIRNEENIESVKFLLYAAKPIPNWPNYFLFNSDDAIVYLSACKTNVRTETGHSQSTVAMGH